MPSLLLQIFGFPINCLHAGIVEFEDGVQFYGPLYDCCYACHFPDYLACILDGNPDWLCASRAYKCMCDCRETHLTQPQESASKPGSSFVKQASLPSSSKSHKKGLKSESFCEKKVCNRFAGDGCCIENRCIKMFVHKKKSPVRP